MTTKFEKTADLVTVAEFDSYAAAERAVNNLSEQDFPVEHATICGAGLRVVEHVLGRATYLRAAAAGAATGAWIGLLVGLFLALFTTTVPGWLATLAWGVVWGVIAGVIIALVWHALPGGRREFVSARELLADRYEVMVSPSHADRARDLLRG
ncbi:hypothetical protein IU501_09835 [Nocardia otitidiscaviarum]|uniref:general stress protein n=1 Tax=Nocardia otitidiscaviarum TaxID=1823 RepID=UPI0005BAF44B|nr:general stress protein [Nocardia otitidiscaviarum]MBF6133297.1 hypothetical protein [Nocardia otitidiscaviarum]MBF6486693.1 hypothetical protein [Nocardia otitidiscaviarum]